MFLARLAVELGVLLLIATAANVPLGVMMLKGWDGKVRSYPIRLTGKDAAAHGWGWRTPSEHPAWPAPTLAERADMWGYSSLSLRYIEGNENTYSMELETGGWPLRVVGVPQYWYPSTLTIKGSRRADPAPGVELFWPGVFLNPLIVSAGMWVLLVAPFEVFFAVRWRRRLKRRLCPYCAYPAGRADVCTECGRAATLPLRV